jgi:osmotically-inducible protein OsmY
MSTANTTSTDQRLRDEVVRQLEWDPDVDTSGIAVAVQGAAVCLTGSVDTYAGKLAAERAAKRAGGVRAVANDLHVRALATRTDAEIAVDAAHALARCPAVPSGVQASVAHGWVTLTGEVATEMQSAQAESAVSHVAGVRNLHNRIVIAPPSEPDTEGRVDDLC